MAGGVINRHLLISRAQGLVRANNADLLKEFDVTLDLSEGWATDERLGKMKEKRLVRK